MKQDKQILKFNYHSAPRTDSHDSIIPCPRHQAKALEQRVEVLLYSYSLTDGSAGSPKEFNVKYCDNSRHKLTHGAVSITPADGKIKKIAQIPGTTIGTFVEIRPNDYAVLMLRRNKYLINYCPQKS